MPADMSTSAEARRAGEFSSEIEDGRWKCQQNRFTDRLDDPDLDVLPSRFRLYVCLACPWAHRQMIVRAIKGIESALPMTIVDPIRDQRGSTFATTWDDESPQGQGMSEPVDRTRGASERGGDLPHRPSGSAATPHVMAGATVPRP